MRRVLPVVLLAILVAALYLGTRQAKPEEGLYSGVVEATTFDLAFEVPGRLEAFSVQEGQSVAQGAEVARLREADLEAQLEAARAREGIAKAQLDAMVAGSRPGEIGQAEARVQRAAADLQRLQNGATAEEIEAARAQAASARQRYEQLENGFRREDIEAARAAVGAARSTLETAQEDLERYQRLDREGAIPHRTLDEVENRHAVARSQYETAVQTYEKLRRGYLPEEREAARQDYEAREASYRNLAEGTRPELIEAAAAELSAAQNALELVREGPREEDVRAARRRLQEAKAAVEAASLNLAKARLRSPAAGVVLSRNFEVGEMVQPGQPVVTLQDLEAPWVEIFVPETEIGQVKLGDAYTVSVDSLPGKVFAGKVTRIYEKAEFTPKTIQTERERVNLVFRVKVEVQDSQGQLKPGMPADARSAARG